MRLIAFPSTRPRMRPPSCRVLAADGNTSAFGAVFVLVALCALSSALSTGRRSTYRLPASVFEWRTITRLQRASSP